MGSVKKIDRKKPWRARYRGPDGREHSRTFRTQKLAEKWLKVEEAKAVRGEWVDPTAGTVTFGDWSESWIKGLDLKPSTEASYRSNLRSRILPTFSDVPLAAMTPARVREWIADLRDGGLSAASIKQARQVVHAALDVAVSDGILARNPVDAVKPPTVRQRRQLFLTASEVDRLANAAEERQATMGALVLLLAWSGMRWGEAVALRGGRVNRDRRRVRVAEAVTEVSGRLEWGTPKTHELRTVIVPRFVLEALPEVGDDSLVFTAPRGGTLRVGNFRRDMWHPACEASDMPEGLLVHDLRDTAASIMISSGASIKAVQRALGHASAKMTLDVYGGLFEEDLEALADRLEDHRAAQERHKGADVVRFPR